MTRRTSLAIALATTIFSLIAAMVQLVGQGSAIDLARPAGMRNTLPRSNAYASAPSGSRAWPDRSVPVQPARSGR